MLTINRQKSLKVLFVAKIYGKNENIRDYNPLNLIDNIVFFATAKKCKFFVRYDDHVIYQWL